MYQLAPGTEFAGFVVEDVIGTGGMSVLYRARDPHLQRVVALKVMSAALSEDDDFRRRFTEEARLAAAIDHPNVVPIYGFGQVGESLYIAMRYVPGTDLRKLLRDEGALTASRTSDLLGQVAAALDVVHHRGMVHRDVKPDNVLITPGAPPDHVEYAYLADFGLTRSDTQSRITQAGQIVGTLAYAAPEQLRGEEVGAAADVYSLGCVLFECLAGDRPFRRNNDASVIYAHLHDPPPPLTAARPDLPRGVDDVIAIALAKDPAHRYASAGDLLRAFRAAAGLGAATATSEVPIDPLLAAATPHQPPVEVWAAPVAPAAPPAVSPADGAAWVGSPTPGPVPATAASGSAGSAGSGRSVDTIVTGPRGAATTGRPRDASRRGPVLVGVTALVVLAIVVGIALVVRRENPEPAPTGSGPGTTDVDVAGYIGSPVPLSDDGVVATRSLQFTTIARTEVRVQLKIVNHTSNPVLVQLLDEPPATLASSRSSVQTTSTTEPEVAATAPPAPKGTGPGPVTVPFDVVISRNGQATFEYTVELDAPADASAIQRWAAAFPATPVNTVTGLI